jgi:hypothetical protein
MSQPTPYNRSSSFTNTFAANPTQTFPGSALDAELNNVKTTLDQVLANLALLQNDSGTLANGIVGPNQVSSALLVGFTAPTVWQTGVQYPASPTATVFHGTGFYTCQKTHTAGTFAADLAAGDWLLVLDFTSLPLTAATQVSVTPAGNITQVTVQSALQQLDTIKMPVSTAVVNSLGGTSGVVTLGSGLTMAAGVLSAPPQFFGTRAVAAATAIAASVTYVRTAGYAAAGDNGGATYIPAVGTTTGGFQSADGAWWKVAVPFVTPQMFGAKGDNINDDTTAIQNAITVAQAVPHGVVEFPVGQYKCTGTINVTGGIYLRGVGHTGNYSPLGGSMLMFYGVTTGLSFVTDVPFICEKLSFYPVTNAINTTLVFVDSDNSSSIKVNAYSVFRDCCFQNASFGINAPNFGLYTIDNCTFLGHQDTSVQTNALNAVGGGDCNITNCTFSGTPSNGHFRTGTLGGMRIVNNKFNSNGTPGLTFVGAVVSAFAMSPIVISNNSIEGTNAGIAFQRTGAATVTAANLVITGNEISATGNGSYAIGISQGGGNANQWVNGGIISGNLITVNNGTGIYGCSLNACADLTIVGNQFTANSACPAINLGGNTARITQANNGKGLNVT